MSRYDYYRYFKPSRPRETSEGIKARSKRGAFAKNSIAMARRRLEQAEAVGAEVVLTECNSCVHNLSNAKLRKQKFKIYNTSEFINKLMEENE